MSDASAVHRAEERLQTILKAVVVGARAQDPASRPGGEDLTGAFTAAGAIEPPYDPEALCLAGDIFNREFRRIGDDWTKRPITLTLAGVQTGVADLRPQMKRSTLLAEAQGLLDLREELVVEEGRINESRLALAREYLRSDPDDRDEDPS